MTAEPLAFFDASSTKLQQLWAATDCGTYEQECRKKLAGELPGRALPDHWP